MSVGALYVLLALGFAVTLGIGEMVNLAHGGTVVAGMYAVYALSTSFSVPVYLAVVAAVAVCTLLSLVIYLVAIEPSRRSGGGHADSHREQVIYTLVITSALAIVFQLFFGGALKGLPFTQSEPVRLLGVSLSSARLIALVVATVVTVALVLWLRYSTIGRLVLMTGKYTESAYAIGVPVQWVFLAVFCLGGALAGLAGGLLMTILPVSPTIGLQFLIIALIVSIAGRLAFVGVGIVGLAYGIGQAVLSSKLSGSATATLIFAAFLAVLSLERIFAGRMARRQA